MPAFSAPASVRRRLFELQRGDSGPGSRVFSKGHLRLAFVACLMSTGCASAGCRGGTLLPSLGQETPENGPTAMSDGQARTPIERLLLDAPDPQGAKAQPAWVRHARGHNWWGVLAALDAATPEQRADASLRYLCARAAAELGLRSRAETCVRGLEERLPLLRTDVMALARRIDALPVDPPLDGRMGRIIVAERAQTTEHADASPPSSKPGASVKATASLSRSAHLRRARKFAKAGDVPALELELARARAAESGDAFDELEEAHLRGRGLYEARRYAESLPWLQRSAEGGTGHSVEDQFRHARALARADRNEDSIAAFRRFVVEQPQSTLVPRARYLAARLLFIMGRWKEAIAGYDEMRRLGDRGRRIAHYPYERAVSLLAAGEAGRAVEAFGELIKKGPIDREVGRLQQLLGLALFESGQREQAYSQWRRLIAERPFSLAAEFARMRLQAAGQPVPVSPSAIAAGPARRPGLPKEVAVLEAVGLHDEAERHLSRSEAEWSRSVGASEVDRLRCETYGQLSFARRRYQTGSQIRRARASGDASWGVAAALEPPWLGACSYPTAHGELVEAAESGWSLPPYLMHAVMMAESAFRPTVVSHAKAVGLMQLIPPTAKRVAAELSVEYSPRLLERPAYSIAFGAHYLQVLSNMWDGNLPLIVASYNAGPKVVSRWMQSGEQLPMDVFVARIPYGETRGYVYRVLTNLVNYRALYAEGRGGAGQLGLEMAMPKGRRAGPDAY